MENDIFKLDTAQLKEIAEALKSKIDTGLAENDTEVLCIPTYINPKTDGIKGKALVLDLGGTNYRVAVIDFNGPEPVIQPSDGWKRDLSVMKTPGFTEAELLKIPADPIHELRHEEPMPIGYCFSYPTDSMDNGDASLMFWNKGVDIPEMVGKPVGKPLLDYLNKDNDVKFTDIKVINDTVAALFAGVSKAGYDAYIGLIVGTGTNMATFFPGGNIPKIAGKNIEGSLPINLESGNFKPPHLTEYDKTVDAKSQVPGRQLFEKAISGMYLGEILKAVFPDTEFGEKVDASTLTSMMSYPDIYKQEYVQVARAIYLRSANLVAASIVGLVLNLREANPNTKHILLTAEGGLYWSCVKGGKDYNELVMDSINLLLKEYGLCDVAVEINKMDNANLIGTGVAALS